MKIILFAKTRILLIISSFITYVNCYFEKIIIGKNNVFFGIPYFYKKKGSSIHIGKNCTFRSHPKSNLIGINRKCIISTNLKGAKIIIGNNCGFSGTVIGAFCNITIKNNVRCGANTTITDSDWHLDDPRSGIPKPVVIEDNVWIGLNTIVLKGVTIGENSVIGAGSIVVNNIPANVIAAGNPCKVIKHIHE